MILNIIIGILIGLAGGFGIAKFLEKSNVSNLIKNAKKEASSILRDAKAEAETEKRNKLLQAKERFLELKSEHEKEILSKDKKMAEAEKRTRDKESQVSSELAKAKKINDDAEAKITEYQNKIENLEKKSQEVDKLHKSQIEQLEVISGLSADDARNQLVESLKAEAKTNAMAHIQETIEEAKITSARARIATQWVGRVPSAKPVDAGDRLYGLMNGELMWTYDMAAVGQEMQNHLWARLKPLSDSQIIETKKTCTYIGFKMILYLMEQQCQVIHFI